MRCWRIYRHAFAAGAATGEGARLYGGRWNSPGISVVYAATSLALAAVETFVNLDPNLLPNDLESIEGEIPDEPEIPRVDETTLPPKWYVTRTEPLRKIGDRWTSQGKSVALLVPSAAIRGEWNILLNPGHPDYRKMKFKKPVPFEFDPRMFARP